MMTKYKYSQLTLAIFISLLTTACTRFDTRMQAGGNYDYDETSLQGKYQTGKFSHDEARNTYNIPVLTKQQKSVGFIKNEVDIRPPAQLIPVIDGVLLDQSETNVTKLLFNPLSKDENIKQKVWNTLLSYLAKHNVDIVAKDKAKGDLTTGIMKTDISFGGYFSKNRFHREASYRFQLSSSPNENSVALTVDALSYKESNDGTALKVSLTGSTKKNIEINFLNQLLAFVHAKNESAHLEKRDSVPLSIKLGFDDNHQYVWIVESSYADTWEKLPRLFKRLNFSIVESDKNLGNFLVKYTKPSKGYWKKHNLEPFELESGEYFIQLGEITGGTTSLIWFDKNKKLLLDDVVKKVYMSITNEMRKTLLLNAHQKQLIK
ncbi:MAG: outer membrane protein assembly factor BamC [Psychromonas sp.]|nr:outer membrane protein assembly factor BamC [Psychromonas sp.]